MSDEQKDKFSAVAKGNFQVLVDAHANKQLGMLACTLKSTGQSVAVICAFTQKTMIPLAVIPDNIMEMLEPPDGVKELSDDELDDLRKGETEKLETEATGYQEQ